MASHRWTIPCKLDPEAAEHALAEPLGSLVEQGWELITHIETVGFFGWTLRAPDERAVGLSVPQPGTPDQIVIRSDHPDLAEQVIQALTATGPLEGAEATPVPSRGA